MKPTIQQRLLSPQPVSAKILGVIAAAATSYLLHVGRLFCERRNALRVFFIVLCLGCTFAIGQSTPPASADPPIKPFTESSYSFKAADLITKVSSQITNRMAALRNNLYLHAAGSLITSFLLVALLVWAALKTMASGKGLSELIGEWISIILSLGVVTLFLDRSAGDLIVSTMDFIAAAIGGADMSSLDSALSACAMPIFKAIAAVAFQPHAAISAKIGGVLDVLSLFISSFGSVLVGLITKSLAVFVLMGSLVGIMANIIMGFISVQLVLALAPVMVPFLMFKPLEWLFDAWLKFLLGACMIKVVLAFLLGATSALLDQMSELAHQTFSDAKGFTPFDALISDVLLLVLSLVFAVLATLLIAQAPRIAAGLLAGSSGSVGFSGIKAATGGVPERVMSKGLSTAGGRIVQNLKNSASARAGARDGKSGALSSLKYRNPEAKAAYDEAYRDNKST